MRKAGEQGLGAFGSLDEAVLRELRGIEQPLESRDVGAVDFGQLLTEVAALGGPWA